jgi:hypothetical protein
MLSGRTGRATGGIAGGTSPQAQHGKEFPYPGRTATGTRSTFLPGLLRPSEKRIETMATILAPELEYRHCRSSFANASLVLAVHSEI